MDLVQFKKDVSLLSKVVPKKGALPNLQCIWLKGGVLAATDLEQFLLIKSDVTPFPKPVNAVRLNKILGGPGVPTRMAVSKEGLEFDWENGRTATIPFVDLGEDGVDPEDAMPSFPKEHTRLTDIEVDPYDLAYVNNAVSTEVVRYALTGICFDGRKKHIVASDGKRLHFRAFKAEKEFDEKIVGPGTIDLIRAIHKEYKAEVKITKMGLDKDGMQGSFYMGRHILFGRLIDGNFPDWQVVVPKNFTWTIKVVTDDLRAALTRAVALCQGGNTEAVQLRITEAGLKLKAKNFETEPPTEENYIVEMQGVDNGVQGDIRPLQFAVFNPSYLRDTLCNSERTILQGNDKGSAIVVNGSAVLMPLTIALDDDPPKEGRMSKERAQGLPKWHSLDLVKPVKIAGKEAKSVRQKPKPKPEKRANPREPDPVKVATPPPPPRKRKASRPKARKTSRTKARKAPRSKARKTSKPKVRKAARPKPKRKHKGRKPAASEPRARDMHVPLFNW